MADPIELYLVRHGIAEERGAAWPDDSKRPLSEDGTARFRKAASGLEELGVTLDLILTSPLLRARQTADILASELDSHPHVVQVPSLAPGGTFQAVVADLEKHGRRPRIALVGHEPSIGELAARLVGTRHAIEFKKGAICRIDVDAIPPAAPGDLRWFLSPKILRRLGS